MNIMPFRQKIVSLNSKKWLFFLVAVAFLGVILSPVMTRAGGDPGSENNPWEIYDLDDLARVGSGYEHEEGTWDLDDHYILMNDIDASPTGNVGSEFWNDGAGWEPIGEFVSGEEEWFGGVFDGDGHTIYDLYINRPETNDIGLFGRAAQGEIKNVTLENVDITGESHVGGLIGNNTYFFDGDLLEGANIDNVLVTGSVSSEAEGSTVGVGGLVGSTRYNVVSNSGADVLVQGGLSQNKIGGLIGYLQEGEVINSYAEGEVVGGEGTAAEGVFISSFRIGGLIGANLGGTIYDSHATGNVTGNRLVGGLIGEDYTDSEGEAVVDNTYAIGDVTGDGSVGGLIGQSEINLKNSYATGDVIGESQVGGLIGSNRQGSVSDSYAEGDVVGVSGVEGDGNYVGGLIGYSWEDGNLINPVEISDSYALGNVSGNSRVGGLIGDFYDGVLNRSYYLGGQVEGSGNSVGGLIGRHGLGETEVDESFAVLDTVVGNDYGVGGLIGKGGGDVINSYAVFNEVIILDGWGIGGLYGWQWGGEIKNSYAIGDVTGNDAGGLIGEREAIVIDSVASDSPVIGVEFNGDSIGLVASLTDEELRDINTYTAHVDLDEAWDIETTDQIDLNDGLPFLGWQKDGTSTWYIFEDSDPAPATFLATFSDSNSPVVEGEILEVDYSVENTGGQEGTQDIRLEIAGNEKDVDTGITLDHGESATGTLSWSTEIGDSGSYSACVVTDNDQSCQTIEIEETPAGPDNPTDLGPPELTEGQWLEDPDLTFTFQLSHPDDLEVRYRIQIARDPYFNSPEVDYTSGLSEPGPRDFTLGQEPGEGTYQVGSEGQELPAGSYFWQVQAIDQGDRESDYTKANEGNMAFGLGASGPPDTLLRGGTHLRGGVLFR